MRNSASIPQAPSETRSAPALKTCIHCHATGYVWYQTTKGRWMLAEPIKGSLAPNPYRVHVCPVLQAIRGGAIQRSHKRPTWKRGRSPSSYR